MAKFKMDSLAAYISYTNNCIDEKNKKFSSYFEFLIIYIYISENLYNLWQCFYLILLVQEKYNFIKLIFLTCNKYVIIHCKIYVKCTYGKYEL